MKCVYFCYCNDRSYFRILGMKKFAELLLKIENFISLANNEPTVYGPYKSRNGRQVVVLIGEDGKRKTMSYPKYLMQQHLGKDVGDLTTQHKDGDHQNQDLNNLELLPRDLLRLHERQEELPRQGVPQAEHDGLL